MMVAMNQTPLLAHERFGGDADFELCSEASSLSFHRSDFGVIRPSQTSQTSTGTLAPFSVGRSVRAQSANGSSPSSLRLVESLGSCMSQ